MASSPKIPTTEVKLTEGADANKPVDPISAIPFTADSYSPELVKLIGSLVKSNDPLDQASFDRIAYINNLFPDVLSLMSLDPAVAKLKGKVNRLDEEIVKQVRSQSKVGAQGKKDLEDAKQSINELFFKVKDIKEKAAKSEQMVMDITRDIKSLDHAKKYLTTSIKYLKQLRMQMSDVEQLKIVVAKRQYREIGNLLEIVLERQQSFTAHSNIPKIKQLSTTVDKLKDELTRIIYAEFAKFEEAGSNVSPHLGDICFVVDALGLQLKDEFITKFVDGQLQDYRNSFQPGIEISGLDFINNRYYWLQREMQYFDETYGGIFPPSWKMQELIAEEFCIATRLAISSLLENTKAALDVVALVRAIERTIEFERALCERFREVGGRRPSQQIYEEDEDKATTERAEEEETASGGGFDKDTLQRKWKVHQQNMEKEEAQKMLQKQQEDITDGINIAGRPSTKFKGIISSCFDPYMDLYIAQEDRNMKEMLEHLISEETWTVPEDEQNKVLSSSTDVIYYFNEARKRCSKLTRGQPFFDLFGLFKKYLSYYASVLAYKLPAEGVKNLAEVDTKTLCIILNTAEYCLTTINQMKETITRVIDENFKEKVNLDKETTEFSNVIDRGLKTLVGNVEFKLEPALVTMTRLNWGAEDDVVGEESSYVNEIDGILASEMPLYRGILGAGHFSYFCDLFVVDIINRIVQNIYKLRRVSEVGAQKLLLDISTLKKVFEMMPVFGLSDGATAPSRFIRRVNKEMGRAEQLLKVLLIPSSAPDKIVEMFRSTVTDGSGADFQKVLEMKGFRAKEKDELMAKYLNTGVTGSRVANPRDALNKLIQITNVF